MNPGSSRPPLNTPAGCFMSNTANALFGMMFLVVGTILGNAVGGEEGAKVGLVVFSIFGFFAPWRRWVLNAVRKRQARKATEELERQRRAAGADANDPAE